MTAHTCGQCFRDMLDHPADCGFGCRHQPALCCVRCECRSFLEAHPSHNHLTRDVRPADCPKCAWLGAFREIVAG